LKFLFKISVGERPKDAILSKERYKAYL